MCGIFGIAVNKSNNISNQEFEKILNDLFIFSESRGKEASGVAFKDNNGISVLKSGLSASQLIKSKEYTSIKNKVLKNFQSGLTAIGHSRLVTNGRASLNANNQPVSIGTLACIHNGIVTNDASIWNDLDSSPGTDLDTEALINLVDSYREDYTLDESIKNAFIGIEGSESCAFLDEEDNILILAYNNGYIYYFIDKSANFLLFSSEYKALKDIIKKILKIKTTI